MAKPKQKETPEQQILSENLNSLLVSKEHSDVTLIVGEKQFAAHKAILAARSPVFSAMFSSELKECREGRAEITDIDCEVFEHLLKYIYTGEVPPLDQFGTEVFMAADKVSEK